MKRTITLARVVWNLEKNYQSILEEQNCLKTMPEGHSSRPATLHVLEISFRHVAICESYLCLMGEKRDVNCKKLFESHAEYGFEYCKENLRHNQRTWGSASTLGWLESALLSGRDRLVAVTRIDFRNFETTKRLVMEEVYCRFLYAVSIGNYELAKKCVTALLTKTVRRHDGTVPWYAFTPELLAKALFPICENDVDGFLIGIRDLLNFHDKKAAAVPNPPDGEVRTMFPLLISTTATMLVNLARRRGMDAQVDDPYVPSFLIGEIGTRAE